MNSKLKEFAVFLKKKKRKKKTAVPTLIINTAYHVRVKMH